MSRLPNGPGFSDEPGMFCADMEAQNLRGRIAMEAPTISHQLLANAGSPPISFANGYRACAARAEALAR
jgi:hypothetical protein